MSKTTRKFKSNPRVIGLIFSRMKEWFAGRKDGFSIEEYRINEVLHGHAAKGTDEEVKKAKEIFDASQKL